MKRLLKKFFIERDDYGPDVSLKWDGKSRFLTKRGAVISIVCKVLTFVLFIEPLSRFISRADPITSSYTLFEAPGPSESFPMKELKQEFAIGLTENSFTKWDLDPRIGKLMATYHDREK